MVHSAGKIGIYNSMKKDVITLMYLYMYLYIDAYTCVYMYMGVYIRVSMSDRKRVTGLFFLSCHPQVMRNLHVVFTMNPSSEGLKDRAATSPALFNRCVLNWFGDWSTGALYQVGHAFTNRVDLDRSDVSHIPTTRVSYCHNPCFILPCFITLCSMHACFIPCLSYPMFHFSFHTSCFIPKFHIPYPHVSYSHVFVLSYLIPPCFIFTCIHTLISHILSLSLSL